MGKVWMFSRLNILMSVQHIVQGLLSQHTVGVRFMKPMEPIEMNVGGTFVSVLIFFFWPAIGQHGINNGLSLLLAGFGISLLQNSKQFMMRGRIVQPHAGQQPIDFLICRHVIAR